jgi:transcriptional regulator with XRE-family HTH domain
MQRTALGERIRQERRRVGLSQTALAQRIDISPTALNDIETGKTPDPRVSRIKAIADTLQVSTDYLVGLTDDSTPAPAAPAPRRRRAVAGA